MYGKETLSFEEVAGKILSEERRMKNEDGASFNSVLIARSRSKGKQKVKTMVCWNCGRTGHVKKNCPGKGESVNGSESNPSNVSLVVRDDDLL